jgi:hypothetical protein
MANRIRPFYHLSSAMCMGGGGEIADTSRGCYVGFARKSVYAVSSLRYVPVSHICCRLYIL